MSVFANPYLRIWIAVLIQSDVARVVMSTFHHENTILCGDEHSQLLKRERPRTSFLYWLDWKSKHFNWKFTEWKATQPSLRDNSIHKIVQMGALLKSCKFHTNPYNFVACLPNPYKVSIFGDIWRATILPFSSFKYFYSWLRLSNLADLSFG